MCQVHTGQVPSSSGKWPDVKKGKRVNVAYCGVFAFTCLPLCSSQIPKIVKTSAFFSDPPQLAQNLKVLMWLLGARTLLGAPGRTTRNKKLLGAPGIATRSKDATRGSWHRY